MSISFTAEVTAHIDYMNDERDAIEHTSEVLKSTLDLGNFRALRCICPKVENGSGSWIEDCGEVEMPLMDAAILLSGVVEHAGLQVQAALTYMLTMSQHVAASSPSAIHRAAVTFSWG